MPGEEDMLVLEKTNIGNAKWPKLDAQYYLDFNRTETLQLTKDQSLSKLSRDQENKDAAKKKTTGGSLKSREKELLKHYQMPSEEEMA